MNNLNSILDYLKVFNNINKRPAYEPRTMAQEPRNMYNQGQLVRNTVDGSRPGYGGPGSGAKKGSIPRQTSATKRATRYKKILENLPEGYFDEYVKNFYNEVEKTGKLTHVGGGLNTEKGIPYMEKKYGNILKETFPSMPKLKIKDVNAAIIKSIEDQIESGLNAGRKIRKADLEAIGSWYPKAPKGMETHHFLPKVAMEGTDLNYASSRNTAFISKELNGKMSPYDTKLKANQKKQIKLLNEKLPGWEKKIEDLNTRSRALVKNAAKEIPGSAGYLGFSEMKITSEGKPIFETRGIDYNKSLSGINEADTVIYKNISDADKIIVNKMSNIKATKPVVLGSNLANIDADMFDFRKLPDDVRHIADITKKYAAESPKVLSALKKAKGASKWTGLALATEPLWAAPFAAYEYKMGESPERMVGTATWGLAGESEKEELRKATGELGYATKQIEDYGHTLQALKNKYLSFNDQNDPRGEGRKITENMYTNTHGKYNKAYNMFVDDQGKFDQGKYDQSLNNYTAGLVQIDKFKKQKQDERVQKAGGYDNILQEREIRNIKGYAEGGLAGLMKKYYD